MCVLETEVVFDVVETLNMGNGEVEFAFLYL